jgi:Ca2+-binding RTX toxin-like protein
MPILSETTAIETDYLRGLYFEAPTDPTGVIPDTDYTIDGTPFGDYIVTQEHGDDRIYGRGGNDYIDAAAGTNHIEGGDGNDIIITAGGRDYVDGGNGDDELWSGKGRDTMIGGAGNDKIGAGKHEDTLIGGTGDDTMWGGSGGDTFVIASGDGNDIIMDFEVGGGDKIDLTGMNWVYGLADLAITQIDNDTVISFSDGGSVVLKNVVAATLTADEFVFKESQVDMVIDLVN